MNKLKEIIGLIGAIGVMALLLLIILFIGYGHNTSTEFVPVGEIVSGIALQIFNVTTGGQDE